MKRMWLLLLPLLLLACVPPEDVSVPPVPTERTIETENVTLLQAPTEPPVIVPSASDPPKTPAAAFDYTTYESHPPEAPLTEAITLREIDWAGFDGNSTYQLKLRNETVDFSGLKYRIEAFRSDESGTVFAVRIDLPGAWSDLQCLSILPSFGFRFYLDGTEQSDFRLTDQSVVFGKAAVQTRCDSFTMTYQSAAVTDTVMRAAHEWTLMPFFTRFETFGEMRHVAHPRSSVDLSKGEALAIDTADDFWYHGGQHMVVLNALSLTLPIEHEDGLTVPTPEPRMLPISVWTEDVERNKAEGKYGADGRLKDGLSVVYGTWQTKYADFSGFSAHIERFYYWDGGFFLTLRFSYPADWTDEIRKSVRLRLEAYADGRLLSGPKGHGNTGDFFYLPYCETDSASEVYRICEQSNASLLHPIDAKEITFRVLLSYYPEIEDQKGNRYDLTDGKPFYVDRFLTEIRQNITVSETTIPTDQLFFQKGDTQ